MREVSVSFLLEHLKINVGLSIGLISILLCLREHWDMNRGEEEGWGIKHPSEHTQHLLMTFAVSQESGSWHLKMIIILTAKITDHSDVMVMADIIIMKRFKYCKSCQNMTQIGSELKVLEKWLWSAWHSQHHHQPSVCKKLIGSAIKWCTPKRGTTMHYIHTLKKTVSL